MISDFRVSGYMDILNWISLKIIET
jgi:hypothetical protein